MPEGGAARPWTGLVLAAGLSRRLGRPKALLPWAGTTLLEHVLEVARTATGGPLVVVRAPGLPVKGNGVRAVVNPRPEAGLARSLQLGVQALAAAFPGAAAVVFLVDQPFVEVADAKAVLEAYRLRRPGTHWVRPVYDGVPGHPVVIAPEGMALVGELTGDQGLGVRLRDRPGVLLVPRPVVGRCHPAWDIDTPEDYRRALACLDAGP